MSATTEQVRLDKWLWAARFYKNRSLAVEAINGGHVKLNGHRAKPGARLQVGDRLSVHKQAMIYVLTVQQLADKRGPANVARELYEEDPAGRARREAELEARKEQARMNPHPKRKPDKRERRKIVRFVNKYRQENQ